MTAWRGLAIVLCALLVYTLYLPSAHTPAHFLALLRLEHARNVAFWGMDEASRILARALTLYGQRDELAPAAFAAAPSATVSAANAPLEAHMAEVVQRLFHNRYAQGFDALVLLAGYRLAVLAQWLPWVAGFVLLACGDGYLVRSIRSREFLEHSPIRFGLCVLGATLALALLLLFLVLPAAVDPLALGATPLALGGLVARAISHFPV
jgi:hypothetical protein